MRAVLRTVAQCHSHRILHRDVKPGNFMLLNSGPRAPLKGIGTPRSPPQDDHDALQGAELLRSLTLRLLGLLYPAHGHLWRQ